MKFTLLIAVTCLLLWGSSSYPAERYPNLSIVLFNGWGEHVEVEYDGKTIMNLRSVTTDYNNTAAAENVPRTSHRSKLVVKRGGVVAGSFSINPRRIGTIYLFLVDDGSVILEDGNKLPPICGSLLVKKRVSLLAVGRSERELIRGGAPSERVKSEPSARLPYQLFLLAS